MITFWLFFAAGKISELVDLVKEKEKSPFNRRSLDEWLNYFKEEVEALSKIQDLPNYCRNEGDFRSKLLNKVRLRISILLWCDKSDFNYFDAIPKYNFKYRFVGDSSLNFCPKLKCPKWRCPTFLVSYLGAVHFVTVSSPWYHEYSISRSIEEVLAWLSRQ